MSEFRPGVMARFVDHPEWGSPNKGQLIGKVVTIVAPARTPRRAKQHWGSWWRVAGIPKTYRNRNGNPVRNVAECILEPLPPVALGGEPRCDERVLTLSRRERGQ